jgi:EmrB/QacA subfamily drug resistance transporter
MSLSLIIVAVDATIVNVAIPSLQRGLSATASELQWIIDAYGLIFAGLLLTMGALSDRFGRKLLLQLGLLLFGASSLFAAYANSATQLIAARTLMGLGGAMIMPATLSIVVDVFPLQERVKAITIWSAAAGVGVPLGQVLGGWLLELFWWGSIFLVNLPIVGAILILGFAVVPESRDPNPRRLDPVGALLSTIALSSLAFAFIEAPVRGWTALEVLAGFAIAAISGTTFVAFELRTKNPMLDVRLFKNYFMAVGSGTQTIAMLAVLGMLFLLTQYLQIFRGYTSLTTGLLFTPLSIGFVVGSMVNLRAVAALGGNRVIAISLGIVATGLVGISFFNATTPIWTIAIALLVVGIPMGNILATCTNWVMASVPEANAGMGSAINDMVRYIGIVMGVAILGSLANSIFTSNMNEFVGNLPVQSAHLARNSIGAANIVAAEIGGPAGQAVSSAAGVAYVSAFNISLLVSAVVVAVTLLLILWYMSARGRTKGERS